MIKILLLVFSTINTSFAATCMDAGIGPCIPFEFPGLHICPDGSACIVNPTNDSMSICCLFAMLNTGNCSPTTPYPLTTPSGCHDKINPNTGMSDCPSLAYLCNNPGYYDTMTANCPLTCNRCFGNVTATPPSCVDKVNPATGISDCAKNANLCSNAAYEPYMKDECPKTCGFC